MLTQIRNRELTPWDEIQAVAQLNSQLRAMGVVETQAQLGEVIGRCSAVASKILWIGEHLTPDMLVDMDIDPNSLSRAALERAALQRAK